LDLKIKKDSSLPMLNLHGVSKPGIWNYRFNRRKVDQMGNGSLAQSRRTTGIHTGQKMGGRMADAGTSNPQRAGLRLTYFFTLWLCCQASGWLPTMSIRAIRSSINARLVNGMHPFFMTAGPYAIAAVLTHHFARNTRSSVKAAPTFRCLRSRRPMGAEGRSHRKSTPEILSLK
jgi:hypothetical protein